MNYLVAPDGENLAQSGTAKSRMGSPGDRGYKKGPRKEVMARGRIPSNADRRDMGNAEGQRGYETRGE